ncbi:MAG: hypothetical protein KJ060_10830 [Candidatus Hydrogenedentes bacterium]|nr:hypothetical protein [Candidatus Hydrogenedentota bacterium]
MKKHLFVAIALLMAISLPFAATSCSGGSTAPSEPATDVSEPADATEPAAAPEPAAVEEPAQMPDSEAPAAGTEDMSAEAPAGETAAEAAVEAAVEGTEAAGAALTAENIVGKKFSAGGMTFSFEPDGILKVNDQIPGTWSLDGTTLTVGAMGQEYAATIEGDKIIYDGTPLEPVQ